jgi:hypothetical protein
MGGVMRREVTEVLKEDGFFDDDVEILEIEDPIVIEEGFLFYMFLGFDFYSLSYLLILEFLFARYVFEFFFVFLDDFIASLCLVDAEEI